MKTAGKGAAKWILRSVATLSSIILLTRIATGCGGSIVSSTPTTSPSNVQTYMAGPVAGAYSGSSTSIMQSLGTYTFDNKADSFSQSTYAFIGTQEGEQLNYSGNLSTVSRGLLSLGLTYTYGGYGLNNCTSGKNCVTTYDPAATGNWAVELPDHAGGLVQLKGLPFTPLVAANSCPDYSKAQEFTFVTIPAALTSVTGSLEYTWNPEYDTAYGIVSIKGKGSSIKFSGIEQYKVSGKKLMSYKDLTDSPAAIAATTGACSSTFYGGNTVSVPGSLTIANPGAGETITPVALVGVGSSGLLVESNGNGQLSGITNASSATVFQPFLGAGTGAIGLPEPPNPIDTSALGGAQYLGFIYGSGRYTGSYSTTGWSSTVASFGFSSTPSSCADVADESDDIIYGGDFPNNNPSGTAAQANGGFGNCDLAIKLGTQDSGTRGLFRNAQVWVGKNYPANTLGKEYSFPAIAIAGELDGKYAIFLIGVDSTGSPNQAWGIYLLQSN